MKINFEIEPQEMTSIMSGIAEMMKVYANYEKDRVNNQFKDEERKAKDEQVRRFTDVFVETIKK